MVLELVYGRSPSGLFSVSNIALMLILFTAAISDLIARVVPNWLVFIGLMVALVLASSLDGFTGLGFMALGLAGGVLIFFPIYLAGLLGAGDVKLIGVVGAFLGLHQLLVSSMLIFLIGGVVSLITLQRSAGSRQSAQVPYAVAIAAGVLLHLMVFV